MRYAEVADVQAQVPTQLLLIAAASQPSQETVEDWLDSQSLWIDASLRWKYQTPIASAADRGILKRICGMLVAAQCWDVIGGHDGLQLAAGSSLQRRALELLAYDKVKGESRLVLSGSVESDTGEAAVGQPEGSFTNPDDPETGTPRLFGIQMSF